jgi:hypothetical protein
LTIGHILAGVCGGGRLGFVCSAAETLARGICGFARALAVLFLFAGLLLTAWGSSYYHLALDNARLVWDRLPMTIGFMSLVAAIIAERIDVNTGLLLLPVLLAIGIASVAQWHVSEVRVCALLVVLLALCMQPRYTRTYDLAMVGGFYVLAKILETEDRTVFSLGNVVSGHTLKHLAAAGAGFRIVYMLLKRKAITATNASAEVRTR